MEGNKDEGMKCLRIGKEALAAGDIARAQRFLAKAQRLDPTLPVDDLLASASGSGEESRAPETATANGHAENPNLRARSSSSSSSKAKAAPDASSSDSPKAVYSEEQITVVRQIKKQKDYYEILGVERDCTVEDVRKAYRKLSLKVHPDKNPAPGAEEAFKAVSKAFQCLSNEESRKRYDLVGSEEPINHRPAARHNAYGGFNGFYEDVDAEEIFRNFFFGGMAPATTSYGTYRFRTGGMGMGGGGGGAQHMHGTGNPNLRMFIQLLPVILLLLVNFLPSSDPPYSLSRSYPYEQKLETPRGVAFFVKPGNFEEKYPRNTAERMALEERVEKEYVSIVTQNCRLELQRRQWGFGNQTPHCDLLQKYEAAVA